jgi:hypothetical protein
MIPIGSLLGIALVCATIGFIGGSVVSMLWLDHEKNAKVESSSEKLTESENAGDEDTAFVEFATPDRSIEIAHLFHDQQNNLIITVSGQKLANHNELDNQQLQQQKEAAQSWLNWLGVEAVANQISPETAPAVSISVSASSPAVASKIGPPPPRPASKVARKASESIPVRQLSIVEQIDDILQELQENNPPDSPRVVLAEEADHHVVVWIGSAKYDGIDCVSDVVAKATIRKAVERWEKSVK